ncbi:forkhead box protein L2-like [Sycon ciliatum]|uniref:forkhead box protein L2-like n=1 Tax=Sycon ciliatum TaxID=27933 RepID=UPI0031F70BEF
MSLGPVAPSCSVPHTDDASSLGKSQEERVDSHQQQTHLEFNGGDLSDLGWLSQYKPFPTVPRSEEADTVAESVESSIQAQQRSALSQSCLPYSYNVDCNSNGNRNGANNKPICRWPKPAFSYSCLIAMALKKSETGQLPVHDIYDFMESNYPYFKTAPDGWKNSVRHNLSLNKWFVKVDTGDKSVKKKGCLWAINEIRRTAIENEISKWSRKNPHAILAAMAKPGQESGDIGISQTDLTHPSLSMPPSGIGSTAACPNLVMPIPQYNLQYPMAAMATAAVPASVPVTSLPVTTAAATAAVSTATASVTPAAAAASHTAATGTAAAMHMGNPLMTMSPFALPVLWPGYAMPVPGTVPVTNGVHVPGGIPVPAGMPSLAASVPVPPGTIQVPGGVMIPPGMAMVTPSSTSTAVPASAAPVSLTTMAAIASGATTTANSAAPEPVSVSAPSNEQAGSESSSQGSSQVPVSVTATVAPVVAPTGAHTPPSASHDAS